VLKLAIPSSVNPDERERESPDALMHEELRWKEEEEEMEVGLQSKGTTVMKIFCRFSGPENGAPNIFVNTPPSGRGVSGMPLVLGSRC
jgi:hypothetical protein